MDKENREKQKDVFMALDLRLRYQPFARLYERLDHFRYCYRLEERLDDRLYNRFGSRLQYLTREVR